MFSVQYCINGIVREATLSWEELEHLVDTIGAFAITIIARPQD